MSPRTKEQNDEIREKRIRQILEAAAEVYLVKGVTMEIRDVSDRAALGYGTVYHYYRNKHELLRDMLWQAFEEAKAVTETALLQQPVAPPAQRLRSYGRRMMRLWVERTSAFILYKMIADNFHPMTSERFPGLYERFQAELYGPVAQAIRDGAAHPNPEKLANMMIGSLIGCAGLYIHHRHMEIDLDEAVDVWLAGIGMAGHTE